MSRKWNWDELKEEFFAGQYPSLSAFSRYKNISYKTLYARAYKEKWLKQKTCIMQEVHKKTQDAVVNNIKDKILAVNARHIEVADSVLNVISGEIERQSKQDTVNISELNKLISTLEKCQKIQRTALGMDKEAVDNKEDRVSSLFELLKEVFNDKSDGTE